MWLQDPAEIGHLTPLDFFENPSQTKILSHRAGEKQGKYVYFRCFLCNISDLFKKQVPITDTDDNGIISSVSKVINLLFFFSNKVTEFKVNKDSFGQINWFHAYKGPRDLHQNLCSESVPSVWSVHSPGEDSLPRFWISSPWKSSTHLVKWIVTFIFKDHVLFQEWFWLISISKQSFPFFFSSPA